MLTKSKQKADQKSSKVNWRNDVSLKKKVDKIKNSYGLFRTEMKGKKNCFVNIGCYNGISNLSRRFEGLPDLLWNYLRDVFCPRRTRVRHYCLHWPRRRTHWIRTGARSKEGYDGLQGLNAKWGLRPLHLKYETQFQWISISWWFQCAFLPYQAQPAAAAACPLNIRSLS